MNFEINKLITVKNKELAKEYIGKEIYLFDRIEEFKKQPNKHLAVLKDIVSYSDDFPFQRESDGVSYRYCYIYKEVQNKKYERLTKPSPVSENYLLLDKSDTEPGFFKNYDCFMAHMNIVNRLGQIEDYLEQNNINIPMED